ncbi:MAG: Gfo/Idh/MocA family oxidoreductase [Magnetococcus sp. THC-1_WYH]
MRNTDTLSCLIIGCGNIAGDFDADKKSDQLPLTHAGAYTQHGGFRLWACIDPNREKRAGFMQRWNIEEGYDSVDALGQQIGRFDVISICSPTPAHRTDVDAALALRPRVLFCEKPLASNLKNAEAIVAACEQAGVPLIVNYNRRWDASVIRLKHEIENGSWGRVRSVSGVYTRGVSNNGSHMLDLLHFLLGPLRLTAVGVPVFDGFEDDPSVPMSLLTDTNITVALTCGHAHDYSLFELQIVTEFGVISMEDGGLVWRIRRAVPSPLFKNYRTLDSGSGQVDGALRGAMLAAVREVHRTANGERILTSSGHNALAAIRICETAKHLATQKTTDAPVRTLTVLENHEK